MSENDSEKQFGDFSSTGIKDKQNFNKKKIIIGIITFISILLLIIILIIIITNVNKSKKTHLGDIICFMILI